MDDAGRVYRNVNNAPLFVDFVAGALLRANPNLVRTRGLYEPLISREASTIWPMRPTRGVNRGYRDQFFRPDGSSRHDSGRRHAGRLSRRSPAEGAVRRRVHHRLDDEPGAPLQDRGRRRPAGCTRSTATARARSSRRGTSGSGPVNMLGGPDGTLYVVDMYRGVVQEAVYWTDYLQDYIKEQRPGAAREPRAHLADRARDDAARPRARAVEGDARRTRSGDSSHPNGWWRDTAQQLLVQRGDDVGRAAAEAARGAVAGLARQAPRAVDARRPRCASSRRRSSARWPTSPPDVRASAHPVVGAVAERAEPPARRRGPRADGRSELDRPPSACGDDRRAAGGAAARARPSPC